ncbi:MAG: DegT/DnrJ/EryC1/StrS family aminotransferase [Paludibacteraceae bacterium]|nr:DegT/DnrJ/EryC1/StrS family aminotransferase [Paludibacteraceae bacterium]
MPQKRIYLSLAHMSEQGYEQKYIKEAFDTNWVVPLGPNVTAFEELLKSYLGGEKEVVALSAGTAAIHLGLILLGVQPGDEVICQSFTFCASANPITYLGATPVFVDSESDTWNISPVLLEKAIVDRIAKTGKKPKAIIPVHLYGMPAKMDEIIAVADKYQIPILEDAAEALGSCYKGAYCGTLGKVAALSFNGNKMITTSGGGALICSSEERKKEAMFYATQARENFPYYQHEKIGYNYRMSNVCAGIGRGQMEVLEEHIAHHKHIHQLYQKAFDSFEGISLQVNPNDDFDSNFWLSTILIDENKTGVNYETLRVELDTKNIETRPLWKPLHLQPVFSSAPAYVDGTSERLFHQGLCLPSGPCVSDEDVNYIVDSIAEIMGIRS